MVDGVDDGRRLVDVAEAVTGADGLDHEQLRVAAEAGDAVAVRDRARGERRDEGPVAVAVDDVRPAVDDVPGLGALRRDVRVRDVEPGVDDGDLERARSPEDLLRHLVDPGRDVLPFVREARPEDRGQCGLDLARAQDGTVRVGDPGQPVQLLGLSGKLDLDRLHVRQSAHDLGAGEALQRLGELGVRLEADHGSGRRRTARRAARSDDGREGQRRNEECRKSGNVKGRRTHSGRTGSGKRAPVRRRPGAGRAVP